ncbi:MAG: zinc-binding dehydrogenase [Chloroflexi bacterium]|nr:zinc-binding dehydrogenase [Chloroflexota bacterium]
MRALVVTPPGSPQPAEIREVAEPTAGPGEALVKVEAFSLNRGELRQLASYPDWVPGQDVGGIVLEAAADGSGPPAGTRVAAIVDEGGWAERVAAPTNRIAVLPESVTFGAAATLGVAGLTALRGLRVGGSLLNARVLVTGASGGVGRFAVPLAALAGAQVTAVVGRPERGRGLTESGASRVVLDGEPLDGPFDVVMEGVSGPSLARSVRALARNGVVVLYGGASGVPAQLGLMDFRHAPGARVQGFFVYETGVETFGNDLAYLARLIDQRRLQPPIGLELSWRELGRAVAALRDRQVDGKAVLTVD